MLLLTAGDEQISSALASGIMAVRGNPSVTAQGPCHLPFQGRLPEAKPLEPEQARVVSAEMDRQKVAELLRVAMHKEPVDYAGLAYDAEVQYGESLYAPGLLGKIGEKLLVGYALIVLAFEKLFESVGS